ncbi:MAG: hypothetical protein EAX96_20805 [Candidatus Lokiarchaeota archaeon]|nr:hypothetical protein [Candidatus Lokiarchaeota archaeon]
MNLIEIIAEKYLIKTEIGKVTDVLDEFEQWCYELFTPIRMKPYRKLKRLFARKFFESGIKKPSKLSKILGVSKSWGYQLVKEFNEREGG